MAQRKNPFRGIRLVYRRSRPLTKIVVLSAVVLSIVALLTLRSAILSARQTAEDLRNQAVQLEQENSRLEKYIGELGTVQGIIHIAKEKLGLIDPDSVVIQPE
ncbi:MAG: septum formation initiator family protein [Oscillospiraceae bacterium]|nr:septum formation initiator family protein [Oscillospiraceae bacterium]